MKDLATAQSEMRERLKIKPYPVGFAGTAKLTARQQEIKVAVKKNLPHLFS